MTIATAFHRTKDEQPQTGTRMHIGVSQAEQRMAP